MPSGRIPVTVFTIVPTAWNSTRTRQWLWTGLGVTGALYLAWAWHALAGRTRSSIAVASAVALATGAVIVGCVTVPASLFTRLLSLRALVFVGRISYGLYLYHWPLFLAINHAHTGLSGVSLLVARLAVTFAAATISFLLVEEPIRTGEFFRGRRTGGRRSHRPSSRRWWSLPPRWCQRPVRWQRPGRCPATAERPNVAHW